MPIIGNPASGGKKPTTPTIGTATDGGTGTTVSVAFTPSTYIGKGSITYTALSNPGSISATGSGSPITVSGLTAGTAYTFTVKGDTNYGVASDTSSASNSVTPAVPTAFESIATATPNGTNTVTFSSIPQTYKSLQIRTIGRESTGGSVNASLFITMNGDSTANYVIHRLYGNGSTVTADGYTGLSSGYVSYAIAGSGYATNAFGVSIIDVIDYTNTNKYKTVRYICGKDGNDSNGILNLGSFLYLQTTAITSLTLTTSFNLTSGTTFALYGIKG